MQSFRRGLRQHATPGFRVGDWGRCAFGRFLQELLIRLQEFGADLVRGDEDSCCSSTVEVGIVPCSLVGDAKHSVDVV